MVTKWKKFSRQPLVKAATVLVIVAALVLGALTIAKQTNWIREFRSSSDQEGTNQYTEYYNGYDSGYWDITEEQYAYNHLKNYIGTAQRVALLQSEEYISSGDYFNNYDLDSITGEWIGTNSKYCDYSENAGLYIVEDQEYMTGEYTVIENTEAQGKSSKKIEIPLQQKLAAITDLGNMLHELEESGLEYYIKTGTKVYSSNRNQEEPTDLYYLTVNNHILKYSDNLISRTRGPQQEFLLQSGNDTIYMGTNVDNFSIYAERNREYGVENRKYTAMILGIGGIGLLAVLNLLMGAGRKESDHGESVHLLAFDNIYLDMSAAFGMFLLTTIFVVLKYVVMDFFKKSNTGFYVAAVTIALLPGVYAVCWLASFAKHFKKGKWWKHTLVYRCLSWVLEKAKDIWIALGELQTKFWLIISLAVLGVLGLLTFAVPQLLVLDGLVAIAFVIYMYYSIDKISRAAEDVEAGRLQRPITGLGGSFLPLAKSLERIATGVETAVSQRMKSERLKTELITNVSHDIRTPLTSLITYTDLLKSKGLDHPEAPKYLEVLMQKSYRLKDLTDDLFEATKAASGDIPVNIEKIDLSQLFHQSLGELEDKRKSSGLDFHLNLPEHAYVNGDGRLLSRVLENLFSNIFKYSQPNSRVYIDLDEKESTYELTMKNISEHPLNILPDQLSERFLRGDESRSSEGSGLGLSIVQSFVQVQGGKVNISIDGDLFKTVIILDKN